MGPKENPSIAPIAHHGKSRASVIAKIITRDRIMDNFSNITQNTVRTFWSSNLVPAVSL